MNLDIYKKEILRLYPGCSTEEWNYLSSGLNEHYYKPKEFFIEEGKKNHSLGFVIKGLVRAYYISDKGEDVTILFASENNYATDYLSLLDQRPSRYYFQCLEPTTIITLSYQHMENGYKAFSGFERYGRLVAEEILKSFQNRIESFQFNQGEQRYRNFIIENKQIVNRISLTHLSSYLGIQRPSLSRIRRKIARS